MTQPYAKWEDLRFANKEHKIVCETLYKNIVDLEMSVMQDDEALSFLEREYAGASNYVKDITNQNMKINSKLLHSLKMTFWFYTGLNQSRVLKTLKKDENEIDIFNPF